MSAVSGSKDGGGGGLYFVGTLAKCAGRAAFHRERPLANHRRCDGRLHPRRPQARRNHGGMPDAIEWLLDVLGNEAQRRKKEVFWC
jgi:hypothetical protein